MSDWGTLIDEALGSSSPFSASPALLSAQIQQESAGNPNAISPKGAFGLAQLMPGTAKDPGFGITPLQNNTPEENLRLGKDYLNAMLKRYNGDQTAALVAYNWGPGNADKWVAGGKNVNALPRETRDYVSKILSNTAQPMTLAPPEMDMARDPNQKDWGSLIDSAITKPAQGTSWQDVWQSAKKNFFSAKPGDVEALKKELGTFPSPEVLVQPLELAAGGVEGLLGLPQVGHEKDAARELYNHLKGYTSEEGLKQNIATDPGRVATDVLSAALMGRGLMRSMPETTAVRTAVPNPVAEAAARQGVEMPNVIAQPAAVQNIARKVSDMPIAGTPLVNASKQAVSQMGAAKERAVSALGSGNPDIAGAGAREGITNFVRSPHADVAQGYKQVEAQVNPNVRVPLTNTAKALEDINAKRDAAGLPPISSYVADAAKKNGLTYEGIKLLRSVFGEGMKKGDIPSVTKAEGDRIYGALSEDLKGSVGASGGPEAIKTFDYANNLARLHAERRAKVAKLLGATTNEALVDRILAKASSGARGDLKTLSIARSAMSKSQWNDVASAAINKLGSDKAGDFSPERFITGYTKITKGGKAALFDRATRQALDDLATLSTKQNELNHFANTSKTGASVATGALFFEPISTLKALVGGRVLAHALSRPMSIKYVTKYVRAYKAKNRAGMAQAVAGINGLINQR